MCGRGGSREDDRDPNHALSTASDQVAPTESYDFRLYAEDSNTGGPTGPVLVDARLDVVSYDDTSRELVVDILL